ncbi:aspartyl protease family protein [Winogradskyella immobilis]|uniref:Aspartyl protease family protein n=1 Tax=Winogradskyella immobilis TaxID=2816852 RepID=A0ABS8EL90_9FLAO|nr:aspartyl protease family protein [Winogradskyella immobilis]MCC1483979.1 aspartyl protease family protein [Winogradskyella immobilis]MCG0016071.1 aspartyl protease family protein [Winogradskyella immobilis]
MTNGLRYITLFIAVFFSANTFGQGAFNLSKEKSSKIKFKLVNNIIVIPVELNGAELSFVLDTGVSKPILFNLVNSDSLQIKNTETVYLRGLGGGGSIRGLRSRRNILKIGEAICVNQDVSVVFDASINFTPRLGIPVHGIIGYDVFKDFVVEINYSSKYIRLYKPETFKYKTSSKWETIPISLYNRKPYLNAEVEIESEIKHVKLLIDSGGSDALWLFEDENLGIMPPGELYFDDFLGKGLSGSVYGKRSKANRFKLNSFNIDNVNVAFPDSLSLSTARNYKDRNGSISGYLLKRFNIYMDYAGKKMQLKKNTNFKEPFYYNNSGITLEQRGTRIVKEQDRKNSFDIYRSQNNDGALGVDFALSYIYTLKPAFQVVELRESSNAKAAGVKLGDIIVSINNKKTSQMSLQEVNAVFHDKEGKTIRIRVERDEEEIYIQFKLDNVFKKKSLPKEDSVVISKS